MNETSMNEPDLTDHLEQIETETEQREYPRTIERLGVKIHLSVFKHVPYDGKPYILAQTVGILPVNVSCCAPTEEQAINGVLQKRFPSVEQRRRLEKDFAKKELAQALKEEYQKCVR